MFRIIEVHTWKESSRTSNLDFVFVNKYSDISLDRIVAMSDGIDYHFPQCPWRVLLDFKPSGSDNDFSSSKFSYQICVD